MKTMTLCGHSLANVSLSSVPAHTAGAPPPHAAPVHLWHILALLFLLWSQLAAPGSPTLTCQAPSLGETLIPGSLVLTYRLQQRGTDLGWAPLGSQDGLGANFETSLRQAAAVSGFTQNSFRFSECPSGSNDGSLLPLTFFLFSYLQAIHLPPRTWVFEQHGHWNDHQLLVVTVSGIFGRLQH